jgi:uracil-DNA glycosylase
MIDRSGIDSSWSPLLEAEEERLSALDRLLLAEEAAGRIVYPARENILAAFKATPLSAVKVVIIGQDPYHGPGQAHGLCFSVEDGVRQPPSLRNIALELGQDLGIEKPTTGNLSGWAAQGVLMLNSVLSVRKGEAGSHAGKGWEEFTDAAIRAVEARAEPTVFLLWGAYAQAKAGFIDPDRNLVIKTAHPSPFAARKGFFGSKPFTRANDWLQSQGKAPIDWKIG